MKFIVASNALKGSLSAKGAAEAIKEGIENVFPEAEIITIPVSDGGDGFIDALQAGLSTSTHQATVTGPTGKNVSASFLYASEKQMAIIEMASAAGLALLDKTKLDPMNATTFGVGELLVAALDLGAKHIVLGIGGSATNDGGTGMATALGFHLLDESGNRLKGCAANLDKIRKIDNSNVDIRLKNISINVACDVNNPLLGKQGAAAVYAPQKGASEEQVYLIESGLCHLAKIFKNDLNKDVKNLAGGGAAGGLGAGLFAFLNAKLIPGADLLLNILDFDRKIKNSDLLITTEGKLDYQTGFGKAPSMVAKRAELFNVPAIVIAGQIEDENINWQSFGFSKIYSICSKNIDAEYAIANAAILLTEKTQEVVRELMTPTIKEKKDRFNNY